MASAFHLLVLVCRCCGGDVGWRGVWKRREGVGGPARAPGGGPATLKQRE